MTETLATKRVCTALNKAGEPCGVRPLKGTDLCGPHTANHPVASHFAPGHPPTPGAGRPSRRRVIDGIREKIEADFAMVMEPLEGALTAERTFGFGDDAVSFPDHGIRLQAARELLDRAYGKPRQQVEHSGAEGGPLRVEVVVPSDEERAVAIAIALAQVKHP